MRIQTLVVTLVMSCVSSLSIDTTINQSAVAQTANQIRQLRAVGVPVVLPTYLPSGFRRTNFEVDFHRYEATYIGPNNCEVSVTGADWGFGWGGSEAIRQWTVNTPLFGKIILEEHDGSPNGSPNYSIAFASPEGRGVFQEYPKVGYLFNFSCKHSVFSPQQASQILKSMRIVQ